MSPHWLLPSLLALALTLGVTTGCNKGGCDSSQCDPGNQCIDDGTGGGATCHRVCTSQADCPANYYCNDGLKTGGVSWCAQNTLKFDGGPGQWKAPSGDSNTCDPSKGEGANADCDWGQGFACYARSPTDAHAYCTQFACTADSDCPGGWWCSTQNTGPNATSTAETFGMTRNICLHRDYCAPCKKDLDCYVTPGSELQHCVPDSKGNGFCTSSCNSDSNCNLDATCKAPWAVCTPPSGPPCQTDDDCPPAQGTFQHCVGLGGGAGPDAGGACTPECSGASDCSAKQTCAPTLNVCTPRAGTCVGDGTFCSPCRSDVDCAPVKMGAGAGQAPGYCFTAPYSLERFCSATSTTNDCDASVGDPPGCPATQATDNWKASTCTPTPSGVQCIGLVTFGVANGQPVPSPGCWTVNR